jgi:glycosyltransferase involved in cell wall biosynthesis
MHIEQNSSQQKNTTLISFIIPYYNVPAELLRESLDSIINLSLSDDEYEIILIDDGSDISPRDIIGKYKNIRYIYENNQGPGAARNLGIDNAKGLYIQFVDADDKLNSKEYDKCLQQLKNRQPDMLIFNYIKTDEFGISKKYNIINTCNTLSGAEFMLNHNLHGSPWFNIFKLEIATNIKFPTDIMNEDEDFIARLIITSKNISTYPVYAYQYNYRIGSLTNAINNKQIIRRVTDSEKLILRLDEFSKQLNGVQRSAIRRRISQLTMDYIYNSITLIHSWDLLMKQIKSLREHRLYPLEKQIFTMKYYLFSIISANKPGLFILFNLLRKR